MEEVMHHNQYCGRNDKSIYEAVATIRDIIAYAEDTKNRYAYYRSISKMLLIIYHTPICLNILRETV